MHGLEGRFTEVARHRPVALQAPTAPTAPVVGSGVPVPQPAPYVALVADLEAEGDATLSLSAGAALLSVAYDADTRRVSLGVSDASGSTTRHLSRRYGRCPVRPRRLALTLTGAALVAFVDDGEPGSGWIARGRVHVRERIDVHDEAFCAGLQASATGTTAARCGAFGQLGLRDLRFVTSAEGEPMREADGSWLLTATNAGPGFFDAAHTAVWSLPADGGAPTHRADLFFRRPGRRGPGVYGDNATHLVRDGSTWLIATTTWGDLDLSTPERQRAAAVGVQFGRSALDLTRGRHVLDTNPLPLPTDGLRSVATWDPHLVRDGERWLVGFVSATRLFRFHPAVASGPSLDDLTLLAADAGRRATEGTTLVRAIPGGPWRVVASDGRDGRRGQRRAYPVFDLDLTPLGALDAPYLTNLPWPTLARDGDGWLMVSFDGLPAGGAVLGYGTHGDLVVLRS